MDANTAASSAGYWLASERAYLATAFAAGGAFAGAGGRVLLGRLRRGVMVRAPCPELATAALWAVLGWRLAAGGAPAWWLPVPSLLAVIAVPLVVVDVRRQRLPDALTLPMYPAFGLLIVAAGVFGGGTSLVLRAALGALLFVGAHLVVHLLAPASLGAGDVKLSGSLGGVLGAAGWPALLLAAVLATLVTSCFAVVTLIRCKRARRGAPAGVPHGPGLLVAAWLVAAFPGTGLEVGLGS